MSHMNDCTDQWSPADERGCGLKAKDVAWAVSAIIAVWLIFLLM